jgi:two-component system KDP operon response regulator KdpE
VSARPLVLVIDDEPPIRRFLRAALTSQGYQIVEAATGADGLAQASTRTPELILLDLGLPDMDGLIVTQRLRAWTQTPILVLSARGQEGDKIAALDAGADDYVTKPFAMGELIARMRAALRRSARGDDNAEAVFEAGDLRVDRGRRVVTARGEEVHLTPIEYKLLVALTKHPGRVMTHQHLLREVWGPGAVEQHHYLRVYMAQLRHKIERDPARPRLLITEPGVGYRLRDT